MMLSGACHIVSNKRRKGETMDDGSNKADSTFDWKSALSIAAFMILLVLTNSFAAAFILSAGFYVLLRWPWVILIVIGIDVMGN